MSRRGWMVFLALVAVLTGLPARRPPGDDPTSRLGRLQGMVMAARRSPVVGVAVVARRHGDDATLYLTTTGERGLFRLDGLPDGDYRLEFTREGMKPLVKDDVTLRFPFRAVVEVTMEPGAADSPPAGAGTGDRPAAPVRVAGRIVELGGSPLGEVRLRFVRDDGGEDPRSARTRPDGGFELDRVSRGAWRLEAAGVGFLGLRTSVDLQRDTELRICLIRQPPDYQPSPLELMPPEQPIPPSDWREDGPGPADADQPPIIDSRTAK